MYFQYEVQFWGSWVHGFLFRYTWNNIEKTEKTWNINFIINLSDFVYHCL